MESKIKSVNFLISRVIADGEQDKSVTFLISRVIADGEQDKKC